MATQLGELRIEAIEGNTLHGWFESLNDKNVYNGNPGWGAMFLADAYTACDSPEGRLGDLLTEGGEHALQAHITSVRFKTPNRASTHFTLTARDPALFEGLFPTAWESYYVG